MTIIWLRLLWNVVVALCGAVLLQFVHLVVVNLFVNWTCGIDEYLFGVRNVQVGVHWSSVLEEKVEFLPIYLHAITQLIHKVDSKF